MAAEEVILEQWFTRVAQTYPQDAAQFLATEKDPFRNPVGQTLRENLAIIVRQLLAGEDAATAQTAVQAIIRVRAVQQLTARQAVGFLFALRPILRAHLPQRAAALSDKLDEIALLAFEEYVRCREQLAELRANENARATGVQSALEQRARRNRP